VKNGGAPPYVSKMDRPLSNFAAICRLEDILVDASGLQFEAWKRTAEKHGLPKPTIGDVAYALVHHEEFAIWKIFYWADDIVTCKKIAATYQELQIAEFQTWAKENSVDSVMHEKHAGAIIDNPNRAKQCETSETTETSECGYTAGLEEIEPVVLLSDLIRLQTTS